MISLVEIITEYLATIFHVNSPVIRVIQASSKIME